MKLKTIILSAVLSTAVYGTAAAEEVKIDVKAENPVQSTLETLIGKDVTLKLRSGQEVAGKVSEVGKTAVHVSQLKGMEFFDAVVRVDDISAVVMRAK